MPPLPTELRKQLEKTVIEAREAAEKGAKAALAVLGVKPDRMLTAEQNGHRLALRARARALGGSDADKGWLPLYEEVAYAQWHRMLFARFLAENNLLIHPGEGVPVTLQECAELAESEGEADEWMVAAKYASAMLPGIFRRDDPSSRVRFAPNDRQALEGLLNALPAALFQSDDALGWVYQFWQTKAKKEVNASGRKVGGKDIAPVTQLFTEHYMVRFLLENSLGAWWAARHPESPLLKEWEYLRYRPHPPTPSPDFAGEGENASTPSPAGSGEGRGEGRIPAAGTFPGWPATAREVTVMDPCCGSGHFLVAAADILRKMRMEEEGLSEAAAAAAVLRDNLFGLELDARCTQIAAFALAFGAWKAAGYRDLPLPHIACSGVAVGGSAKEWMDLAGDDGRLRYTLERLFELFKDAPDLGSLIDPAQMAVRERMFAAEYKEVAPLLRAALVKHGDDPAAAVFGTAAEGAARAGDLLARKYTFVATNPPYLSRSKQCDTLRNYSQVAYPTGKPDLATAFLLRTRDFVSPGGTYALVTPQSWLYQSGYKALRREHLRQQTWCHLSRLGEGGFESSAAAGAFTVLGIWVNSSPLPDHEFTGIDASAPKAGPEKALLLRSAPVMTAGQRAQESHPDCIVTLESPDGARQLLGEVAECYQGLRTGDAERFIRWCWEIPDLFASNDWVVFQGAATRDAESSGGCDQMLFWEQGTGALARYAKATRERLHDMHESGNRCWGRLGVAVAQIRSLKVTRYSGHHFDSSIAVIVPRDSKTLPAVWAFCASDEFEKAVRQLNPGLYVTNATMLKVPFDLGHWRPEAERLYPEGLPAPLSADPTQWLFKGDVVGSESPLQVAGARLLGYRWPDQPGDGDPGIEPLDHLVDADGIVCLPAVAGESDGAERLRTLLAAAHAQLPSGPRPRGAPAWPSLPASSNAWVEQLLAEAGSPGKSLDQWLREDFFAQHIKLFHNRPFIWHIWDGLKDGFSALVNYHKLDRKGLEKLIFVYLSWWMDVQKEGMNARVLGADARLVAATKLKKSLELILEGEDPYDIYVRWKATQDQAIGWDPDLDDGVRMNIRPFLKAGVLRKQPNIKWEKDRGKNPGPNGGSDRINDLHLSIAFKREARRNVGGGA